MLVDTVERSATSERLGRRGSISTEARQGERLARPLDVQAVQSVLTSCGAAARAAVHRLLLHRGAREERGPVGHVARRLLVRLREERVAFGRRSRLGSGFRRSSLVLSTRGIAADYRLIHLGGRGLLRSLMFRNRVTHDVRESTNVPARRVVR